MNSQDYIDEAQVNIERKDAALNIKEARKFKFGDKIENESASTRNPIRFGFFVRLIRRTGKVNRGLFVQATDGRGKFWEVDAAYVVKPTQD